MPKSIAGSPRYTEHINRRTTQSIFRAFDFAKAIGLPLNRYVVINLRESPSAGTARLFEAVRHKFRDWLNYKTRKAGEALPPVYVYAFENPADELPHVNWAVHVPSHLQAEFDRKIERWVLRVQKSAGPFDLSCSPINQASAKHLAKYVVKGTDPAFVEHFFLRQVHAPQGGIYGKRAGVSPSLGPVMRKAAGFRSRRHSATVAWQHMSQSRA